MGQLWDLVQAYIDRHGTSERQLAKRLGYASSGVFTNWREPRQLPSAQALARFAALSGTPYQRVLDAVLTDAGYLPEPPITDEAIQLRCTPSGPRTRGQQRAARVLGRRGEPGPRRPLTSRTIAGLCTTGSTGRHSALGSRHASSGAGGSEPSAPPLAAVRRAHRLVAQVGRAAPGRHGADLSPDEDGDPGAGHEPGRAPLHDRPRDRAHRARPGPAAPGDPGGAGDRPQVARLLIPSLRPARRRDDLGAPVTWRRPRTPCGWTTTCWQVRLRSLTGRERALRRSAAGGRGRLLKRGCCCGLAA